MKKCVSAFTALLLAGSMLFAGGCSPRLLSRFSEGSGSQLTVDVDITNQTKDGVSIQTAVPEFSGFDTAKLLNSNIQEIVDKGIAEVQQAKKDLEQYPDRPPVPLLYESFFDYSSNADVLSTWITSYNYTGGAHGMTYIKPFTVNRKTGEFYNTLGSLFVDEEAGKKQITEKILSQIKANPDPYFPEAEKTVKDKNGNFNFYIEGDNLVVFFDLYDIAPYAAGIQYFKFPLKDLNVKAEFMGMSKPGAVRKNGMTLEFENKPVSGENGTFLPLAETAQALSHDVEYKDGKYTVDGKAVQPKMINGVAYMPLDYFTETLGEFVIYYDDILRLFTQTLPKKAEAASSESSSSAPAAQAAAQNAFGYIRSFDGKSGALVFDPAEWLTTKDTARLKELKLDPNNLDDGYYIYNPSEKTESLKISDQADYNLISWDSNESVVGEHHVDKKAFSDRLKKIGASTYPYHIQISGGQVVRLEEQYIP